MAINRKTNIDAIVSIFNSSCLKIEQEYQSFLDKENISQTLQIDIKHFLEDARSILDYAAHDIVDTHEIKLKNDTYFPIKKNLKDFENSINGYLPNLKSKNTELYNYLESIQPYHHEFAWLGDFASILNYNKHNDLSPQEKTDFFLLTVEQNEAQIQIPDAGLISLGHGAFIKIGDTIIPGNQILSSKSEQIFYLNQKPNVKKERCVDFKFNGTISALPLIKKIQSELPVIIEKIYNILQNTNFNSQSPTLRTPSGSDVAESQS